MRLQLFNQNSISTAALTELKGGKRFLGTFKSYSWSSPIVQEFCRTGSVSCIGTNQTMKANLYQNAVGDTICIEW
jgi:glutamate racemase